MVDIVLVFEFLINIWHRRVRVSVRGRVRVTVEVRITIRVRIRIWVIFDAIHRSIVYKLEQYLPSQIICGDLWCLGRPQIYYYNKTKIFSSFCLPCF